LFSGSAEQAPDPARPDRRCGESIGYRLRRRKRVRHLRPGLPGRSRQRSAARVSFRHVARKDCQDVRNRPLIRYALLPALFGPAPGATMSEEKTVRRILHFKFTMPSAEGAQLLLKMLKSSAPYATIFGEVNVRFLQNADDRAKILQIVEYNAPETIEANRQSLASDPRVQAYLQVWRSMAPNVEMDVYQEIEG
jgi:hypothetical protein